MNDGPKKFELFVSSDSYSRKVVSLAKSLVLGVESKRYKTGHVMVENVTYFQDVTFARFSLGGDTTWAKLYNKV